MHLLFGKLSSALLGHLGLSHIPPKIHFLLRPLNRDHLTITNWCAWIGSHSQTSSAASAQSLPRPIEEIRTQTSRILAHSDHLHTPRGPSLAMKVVAARHRAIRTPAPAARTRGTNARLCRPRPPGAGRAGGGSCGTAREAARGSAASPHPPELWVQASRVEPGQDQAESSDGTGEPNAEPWRTRPASTVRADGGRSGALPRRVSALGPFILLFLVPSGEASCSLLQPRVPGMDTSWGRTDCCTYPAVGAHGCTQRGWKYLVYPTGGGCACVYWSGYFCSFLAVGCTRMCTSGKVYMRVHMFSVYSPVCAHLDETWLCCPGFFVCMY